MIWYNHKMKTYTRKMYRYCPREDKTTEFYESFQQPLTNRIKYRLFLIVWKITCWKPLMKLIDGPLDNLINRVHRIRTGCNNDCSELVSVDPNEDNLIACGRLPLCAQLDVILYNLDTKNQKIIDTLR